MSSFSLLIVLFTVFHFLCHLPILNILCPEFIITLHNVFFNLEIYFFFMYNENDYQLERRRFRCSSLIAIYFPFKKFSISTPYCVLYRWTLIFFWIPNVQPMSAILFLLALAGSLSDALIVALLSLLGTNIYLGMGPWTINQFVALAAMITFFIWEEKISLIKQSRLIKHF